MASALGKLYNGKDWSKSLKEIEFAINNTVNRATGKTPSKLLFGTEQRGEIVDTLREYVMKQNETEIINFDVIRTEAGRKIEESRKNNEKYANKKRKTAREYAEGDMVMVRNFDTTGGKLAPSYRGPYRVARKLRNDRYIVADVEGFQISQRPYVGTWQTANMKPWRRVSERGERDDTDSNSESENEETGGSESA